MRCAGWTNATRSSLLRLAIACKQYTRRSDHDLDEIDEIDNIVHNLDNLDPNLPF